MPPKKAAKKSAKDHANHDAKDLRRAYEHLGRVEILRQFLGGSEAGIATLIDLAQQEVASGGSKSAAELLRAAEHLYFAAILNRMPGKAEIFGELRTAIREEFDRLQEKAQERWDRDSSNAAIAQIFEDTLKRAALARDHGAYRQALELARGAEALAHVKIGGKRAPKKVAASSNVRELAAS